MDEIDRIILQTLRADGRATLSRLSEVTGLSTSASQARLHRLEKTEVIRGYKALVDLDSIGLPIAAFIEITPLDPSAPDDAPDRLRQFSEIESCYSVAGESSYLLLVRVATPLRLEELLQKIRSAAGVSTRTTVVLSTPFEGRAALPGDENADPGDPPKEDLPEGKSPEQP